MTPQRSSSAPNFELVYKVTLRAEQLMGPHSIMPIYDAVRLACERLQICLDDEGVALVTVALGFRRVRYETAQQAEKARA